MSGFSNNLEKVGSYFKDAFVWDLKAGFITAIVALPLAIAFALASGVPAVMGLYTAVVAGILGSLFGGSRFSITGPTGAMAVIILSTLGKFGIEGLLLAGLLAGAMQVIFGLIGAGKFVKFIPLPIISGFTAGIGLLILLGQVPSFLGLSIPAKEHIWDTIFAIFTNIDKISWIAVGIASFTIFLMAIFPKLTSNAKLRFLKFLPPTFIALFLSTAAVLYYQLAIPQVGDIPSIIPEFHIFKINMELFFNVLPSALTIALLGMLEALLCAVVCDNMTNTEHNPKKELISQGIVNMINPFFNAIPSTAAVARTAVSIKEGAKTRLAGVYHAIILLLIVLFFAGLAKSIPKAFLAGVLIYVGAKMINIQEFKTIIKLSKKDTIVLFATFALTVLTDLVFAVQVGMIFAVGLLFYRMTTLFGVVPMEQYGKEGKINQRIFSSKSLKGKVRVFTIHGPLFFGALSAFDSRMNTLVDTKTPIIILRMKHVSFIDTSGVERLKKFIHDNHKAGREVYLTTIRWRVHNILKNDSEFVAMLQKKYIFEHTQDALNVIEKRLKIRK